MNLKKLPNSNIPHKFIRGPTHITQTDVWVSSGDTLSLFKRRGDWVSGWCYREAKSLDGIEVTLPEVIPPI